MNKQSARIFTIANLFSFIRILLIYPILLQLGKDTPEGNWRAFILMLIAVATDFLDGFFARKLDQRSDVGRIIDPLADKIAVAGVAFLLTKTHNFPFWFFILIIARDLAILLFAPVMISRQHQVPESNWFGKIAVASMAVMLISYTLDLNPWNRIFLYVTLLIIVLSIISYLHRFLSTWKIRR